MALGVKRFVETMTVLKAENRSKHIILGSKNSVNSYVNHRLIDQKTRTERKRFNRDFSVISIGIIRNGSVCLIHDLCQTAQTIKLLNEGIGKCLNAVIGSSVETVYA